MKDSPILISNDIKTIKSNVKNFHPMLRINGLVFNFPFIKNSFENNSFSDGRDAKGKGFKEALLCEPFKNGNK